MNSNDDPMTSFTTLNEVAQAGVRISKNLILVMNKNRDEVAINRADGSSCFIDIEVVDGKLEIVYHDPDQGEN